MNDVTFNDPTNYTGTTMKELTINFIILNQYWDCLRIGSKEWHGGFFQTIFTKSGGQTEQYVDAPHEAFSNAVDLLSDSLWPFYDETMRREEEEHNMTLTAAYNEFKQEYPDKQIFKAQWGYEKARLKRQLFRSISDFLKRNEYLNMPEIEE